VLALFAFDFGQFVGIAAALLGIGAVIAGGFAISKSKALDASKASAEAWRSVAEGHVERVDELSAKVARDELSAKEREQRIVELEDEVARLGLALRPKKEE
jgi:hypothetical protein